jgi:hypothetical protein
MIVVMGNNTKLATIKPTQKIGKVINNDKNALYNLSNTNIKNTFFIYIN